MHIHMLESNCNYTLLFSVHNFISCCDQTSAPHYCKCEEDRRRWYMDKFRHCKEAAQDILHDLLQDTKCIRARICLLMAYAMPSTSVSQSCSHGACTCLCFFESPDPHPSESQCERRFLAANFVTARWRKVSSVLSFSNKIIEKDRHFKSYLATLRR